MRTRVVGSSSNAWRGDACRDRRRCGGGPRVGGRRRAEVANHRPRVRGIGTSRAVTDDAASHRADLRRAAGRGAIRADQHRQRRRGSTSATRHVACSEPIEELQRRVVAVLHAPAIPPIALPAAAQLPGCAIGRNPSAGFDPPDRRVPGSGARSRVGPTIVAERQPIDPAGDLPARMPAVARFEKAGAGVEAWRPRQLATISGT